MEIIILTVVAVLSYVTGAVIEYHRMKGREKSRESPSEGYEDYFNRPDRK